MPPKQKANACNDQSAGGAAESQTTMSDGIPCGKQLRADQLFDHPLSESLDTTSHRPKPVGQLRHSSHTRKCHEGQLQQYLNIKHGQGVNPMAPSHCPDDEEEASQMPLRMLSSMALTQVQPSFMVSQSSQQFRFKPPSQASMRSVPQDHAVLARYMPSVKEQRSSCSSSPGFSVFSVAVLHGGSTAPNLAPISHASSECGSNDNYRTQCDDTNAYQLAPVHKSRVHYPLALSKLSSTPGQHPEDEFPDSLPPQLSFHQLPSSLPNSYTIFATNVDRNRSHAINEASPSDDNHFAESVLRDEGDVKDLVAEHRRRNCAPHLPDNVRLLTICNQQNSQNSCNSSLTNSTVDDLKTPILALLQLYPLSICDIIKRAKQFSHCDIAAINSFPLHLDFNNQAVEYINKAIAEHHSRGLPISDGWWPQHILGIMKLIGLWEDIGNLQSSLKKKPHSHICERYEWDRENRCAVNADIVRKLLDRGCFLKHGVDEEGHTNNLTHPTLSGLIIEFFYTGPNSMGNLFSEVFENKVPCITIALATTAEHFFVKLALDEMAAEGKDVTFKQDVYFMLVHRAKTKVLRVQWVKIGRDGTSSGTTTGVDVDLD
ncbi:hypothetical protein V8E55_005718 [Tylopilus felleus]